MVGAPMPLTRIIFDDVLLTNARLVELVADGHRLEGAGKVTLVDFDPAGTLTIVGGSEGGGDVADLTAGFANLDLVVRLHAEARDVHALAVDEHVVVTNELAALRAARSEPDAEHDVVEPTLDEAEHFLTCATLEMRRLHVVTGELHFEQPVDAAHLLLLAQTEPVLAQLDARLTVLAWRVRTTGHCTLFSEAALALQIEFSAFATAQLANST